MGNTQSRKEKAPVVAATDAFRQATLNVQNSNLRRSEAELRHANLRLNQTTFQIKNVGSNLLEIALKVFRLGRRFLIDAAA
ncbi:hypothetical protein ACQX27_01045 [Corynebacterium diphtheriae]